MQVQLVLDLDTVDVLAASHDHVLLAVEQPEVAVLVDLGPVTGQNKAVSPEDLGGLARLLPVSGVCLLTAVRDFTDDIGFDDFVAGIVEDRDVGVRSGQAATCDFADGVFRGQRKAERRCFPRPSRRSPWRSARIPC